MTECCIVGIVEWSGIELQREIGPCYRDGEDGQRAFQKQGLHQAC